MPRRFSTVFLICFTASLGVQAAIDDYGDPKLLLGTIYETASGTNKLLFTFKRTATRSNSTVHVTRDFLYPNGTIAARELAIFERGKLVFFQLDDRQTGGRASVMVRNQDSQPTLFFNWITGSGGTEKKKTDAEKLQADTLIGDMIPYFIAAHWSELSRGHAVNFRFIAESRLETVGFKLVKEDELTWRGKPAVRFRMEPSSLLIRQLVDPLFFTVEKDGAHRILEYIGRTTPKARDGSKWKDLDARTVYHY